MSTHTYDTNSLNVVFCFFLLRRTPQVDLLLCEKLPNALLTGIALWEETTGATHIMVVAYDTPLSYIWVTEAS